MPVALDTEDPVPVVFPAVAPGHVFAFAVLGKDPALTAKAKTWLKNGLEQFGLGAKTAAGYGWFELGRRTPTATTQPPADAAATSRTGDTTAVPASPADALIAKWRGKLATTGNFPAALPEIAALANDADLKRVFDAVIPEQERRRNRKNNPYWQSFTSGRHGEAGKKILARVGFKLV